MALIHCPECNKKISDGAESCPKCGYLLTPQKVEAIRTSMKEKERDRGLGCLAFLLLVLFIVIGSFRQSGTPDESTTSRQILTSSPQAATAPPVTQFRSDESKSDASDATEGLSIRTQANALQAESSESFFVNHDVETRLEPSQQAAVRNTLYRQQRVDVYESRGGWSRISRILDATSEGSTGKIAEWIPTDSLVKNRPRDLAQPKVTEDSRISGIPKVGEGGLTERDVNILNAAARYYLEIGKATKIDFGDKSTVRAAYYLNFGGPTNTFFNPEDIPNLEERINALNK